MPVINYNPYEYLEIYLSDGLDYIIQNLPASPELSDLNNTIVDYVGSVLGSGSPSVSGSGSDASANPVAQAVFLPILPNIVNNYINTNILNNGQTDASQLLLVSGIVSGIKDVNIDALDNFFDNVDEQIQLTNISDNSKTPVYVASALSRASNDYWNANYGVPPATPWAPYLNANSNFNYANIPFWVSATFFGAMGGFSAVQGLSGASINIISTLGIDIGQLGALIGALGLTAGKVILNFIPKPLSLNKQTIANLGGGGNGGGAGAPGGTHGCAQTLSCETCVVSDCLPRASFCQPTCNVQCLPTFGLRTHCGCATLPLTVC